MQKTRAQIIHFFLLAFLGLSAIVGGAALIISPSGKLLGGLPLSILEKAPEPNFLGKKSLEKKHRNAITRLVKSKREYIMSLLSLPAAC